MSQPTLINLYPKEYLEGLRYYPFVVTLDRCLGSCNTLDDLSNRPSRIKSGITNVGVSKQIQKSTMYLKNIFGNLLLVVVNGRYAGSIIDDSVITCDEIIEKTKTVPTKSTQQKLLTKTILTKSTSTNVYTLLNFLLITIALLTAVSIYCYQLKHQSKQVHSLPCYDTNNKFKEINII